MASKKPKTTVISFRVPIEEREAFEKSAVDAGTTLTGYIHATLVEARSAKTTAVPAPAPAPAQPPVRVPGIALSDPAALSELKRIGININQIAHAANAGLPPAHKEVVQPFAELFGLLSEPDRFARHIAAMTPPLDAPSSPASKPPLLPPPSATGEKATQIVLAALPSAPLSLLPFRLDLPRARLTGSALPSIPPVRAQSRKCRDIERAPPASDAQPAVQKFRAP